MGAAAALSTSEFEQKVIQSAKPVLIDFWAEWCGPCIALGPTVETVAAEYAGKAEVYKVDVDAEGDLAMQFGVMSIPTLIVFKAGKEVDRMVGMQNKEAITKSLDKALI